MKFLFAKLLGFRDLLIQVASYTLSKWSTLTDMLTSPCFSFFICVRRLLSVCPSLSHSLGAIKWKNINIKVLKHKTYDIRHYCFYVLCTVTQYPSIQHFYYPIFHPHVPEPQSRPLFCNGSSQFSTAGRIGIPALSFLVTMVILNGEWINQISSRQQDLVLFVWYIFFGGGGSKKANFSR